MRKPRSPSRASTSSASRTRPSWARSPGSRSPTARAASTSTSRRSGCTSTATRSRPASDSSPSRCGSTSPASAARSAAVTANASSFACGPYAVENALIECTCVYTNNPPCGAMRGFGAVQSCFAHEAQMDKLAAELTIDPVELRLLNALGPGGSLPTGQKITGSFPAAEVIRRAAELPIPEPEAPPRDPLRLPGGSGNTTRGQGVKRGVGFAVGFKNVCYSEGFDDSTAARVRLTGTGDGLEAEVDCAAAEVGQGVVNVILQTARTELELDDVVLGSATTSSVGSAGSASAAWCGSALPRTSARPSTRRPSTGRSREAPRRG